MYDYFRRTHLAGHADAEQAITTFPKLIPEVDHGTEVSMAMLIGRCSFSSGRSQTSAAKNYLTPPDSGFGWICLCIPQIIPRQPATSVVDFPTRTIQRIGQKVVDERARTKTMRVLPGDTMSVKAHIGKVSEAD
jgi:hypothetical protein